MKYTKNTKLIKGLKAELRKACEELQYIYLNKRDTYSLTITVKGVDATNKWRKGKPEIEGEYRRLYAAGNESLDFWDGKAWFCKVGCVIAKSEFQKLKWRPE